MTVFIPSRSWTDAFYAADCPLARVAVSFAGASVACVVEAVRSFVAGLQEDSDTRGSYDQVFFSGGWVLGMIWQDGDYPALTLESAGEDGLDSLEFASQELAGAVAKSCPGAVLKFEELPF